MWQLDTMVGPYMTNGKTSTQAKLIAFIDDASRVVPHGQFFFSENTDNRVPSASVCAFFLPAGVDWSPGKEMATDEHRHSAG
jgi:hypothetical protein